MKVYIGPYPDWVGPYQIADKVFFWCEKYPEDDLAKRWDYRAHDWLGEFLAHGFHKKKPRNKTQVSPLFDKERPKTWFYKLCEWVHSKKKHVVYIKTDRYDCWSGAVTISMMALPILKDLRERKMGAPYTSDDDVPEGLGLRSTEAPPKKHEWDTDDNWFKRWDWILDEMIWAHERVIDDSWEDQFRSGEIDYYTEPVDNGGLVCYRLVEGPNHTYTVDDEGMKRYNDRIQNGLRLFGKYYFNLTS